MNRTMLLNIYNDKIKGNKASPLPLKKHKFEGNEKSLWTKVICFLTVLVANADVSCTKLTRKPKKREK